METGHVDNAGNDGGMAVTEPYRQRADVRSWRQARPGSCTSCILTGLSTWRIDVACL